MYQYIKAIRCILTVFIFLLFFLVSSNEVRADNLLLNSSFEDVSNSAPNYWTKNVSTATLSISPTAKTGTESASINKTNNTTGTIYLYQDVDVEPNSYYSLSGWTVKNDSNFNYSLLRISWRDASAEISKTDSTQLTFDQPTFQELKIDSVQAPVSSIKARIELLANISSPNPTNPVIFDDVSFSQVSAPEQPMSTPVVTTVATPIPISTPTKTPTPTPTKTPKPTPTLSPIPTVLGDSNQEATPDSELGETSSPEPSDQVKTGSKKSAVILGAIFTGLGVFAMGIAGYAAYAKSKSSDS